MAKSERNVKTGINSEIHASLRRLEEADYVSEMVQSENLQTVNDQLSSKVKELQNEVYQLHTYMEPHIYQDDLCYFQNIYVGNLQVDQGASINGDVQIINKSSLTVDGALTVQGEVNVFAGMTVSGGNLSTSTLWAMESVIVGQNSSIKFSPHTLSVNGSTLTGQILATQDLSTSIDFSNELSTAKVSITGEYSIGTTSNNATYAPRTITVNGTTLSGKILATRNIVINTT